MLVDIQSPENIHVISKSLKSKLQFAIILPHFQKQKNRARYVLLRNKSKDTKNNGIMMIPVVVPVLNVIIYVNTSFQNVVAVQLL